MLRPYQDEAKVSVLGAWGMRPHWTGGDTFQNVILSMGTGGGKTITAAGIIGDIVENDPSARCAFIADQDELVWNPTVAIKKETGITVTVEKAELRANIGAKVTVASLQTLDRPSRLERFPVDHFTHLFLDESHRNVSRAMRVRARFPNAKVVGISATPYRAGMKSLVDTGHYDHIAYEMGLMDLVREGYLVPIIAKMIPVKIDLSGVRQKRGVDGSDYDANELSESIRPYYEEVIRHVLTEAPNRHLLFYLPLIASSKEFAGMLNDAGITAAHVDGKSPDRKEIIERFSRGQVQALCNSDLLSTGVDIPIADCMVNLSPTRSVIRFRQRAGRITRALPGVVESLDTAKERREAIAASAKPNSLVLDFLYQFKELGLVGAGSLIADDAEDAEEIQKFLRKRKTPQEIEILQKEIQDERERRLREELDQKAKLIAGLKDAREVALALHDPKLMNYDPIAPWEQSRPSDKQLELLRTLGIGPVESKGYASAILNATIGRQEKGLCAYEAIEPLRAAGVVHPEKATLDEAIKVLGASYPLTFGKARGAPMNSKPLSFWEWFQDQVDDGAEWTARHPAALRYARVKVQRPERPRKQFRPRKPQQQTKGQFSLFR